MLNNEGGSFVYFEFLGNITNQELVVAVLITQTVLTSDTSIFDTTNGKYNDMLALPSLSPLSVQVESWF